jgi:hypothetical protein
MPPLGAAIGMFVAPNRGVRIFLLLQQADAIVLGEKLE